MAESKVPHVLQAIVAIEKAMSAEGIGKGRTNQQQNYKFRGIDDVLNALAAHYAENEIFVLPSYSDRVLHEYDGASGKRIANVCLTGSFRIVSARDASEITSGPFVGEAMDSADKATNKAMSAAYKYFAIQTFSIPTEGDNDADSTTHEVRPKAAAKQPGPMAEKVAEHVAAMAPVESQERLKEAFGLVNGAKDINSLRTVKDELLKSLSGTGLWPQVKAKVEARLVELQAK